MRRFLWGDGLISKLSPAGIDFVEENLLTTQEQVLDGLKDTDNAIRTGLPLTLKMGIIHLINRPPSQTCLQRINFSERNLIIAKS